MESARAAEPAAWGGGGAMLWRDRAAAAACGGDKCATEHAARKESSNERSDDCLTRDGWKAVEHDGATRRRSPDRSGSADAARQEPRALRLNWIV